MDPRSVHLTILTDETQSYGRLSFLLFQPAIIIILLYRLTVSSTLHGSDALHEDIFAPAEAVEHSMHLILIET